MSSSTFIYGTATLDEAAMAVFKSRPSWEWAGRPGFWVTRSADYDTGEEWTEIEVRGIFWNLHAHIAEDLAAAGQAGRVSGEIVLQDGGWEARARYENGRCWYGHGEADLVMRACELVPAIDGKRDWLQPLVHPDQGVLFSD